MLTFSWAAIVVLSIVVHFIIRYPFLEKKTEIVVLIFGVITILFFQKPILWVFVFIFVYIFIYLLFLWIEL